MPVARQKIAIISDATVMSKRSWAWRSRSIRTVLERSYYLRVCHRRLLVDLASHAVLLLPEADNDVSERPVIHVDHPPPLDPVWVQLRLLVPFRVLGF